MRVCTNKMCKPTSVLHVSLILLTFKVITVFEYELPFIPMDAVDESRNFESAGLLRAGSDFQTCGRRNGFYLNRVVSGRRADAGEFPWIVSLQMKCDKKFRHMCGGTIVTARWVVSAGHCLADLTTEEISIVAGDQNLFKREGYEQRRNVIRTSTTNFDLANFENDISLLKTDKPFDFNNNVAPICLPDSSDVFYGSGIIAGWGRLGENEIHSQTLQHVTVPFITKTECDDKYKVIGYSGFLNQCQLCAGYKEGGRDACQGDSGGPLMCTKDDDRYYLCGIISWGVGCARPNYPGIYTKVTCFVDWIKETTSQ